VIYLIYYFFVLLNGCVVLSCFKCIYLTLSVLNQVPQKILMKVMIVFISDLLFERQTLFMLRLLHQSR